jgi:hypothetical protein
MLTRQHYQKTYGVASLDAGGRHSVMRRFSSPESYRNFRCEVEGHARFVRSRSANRFLNAVADTANARMVTWTKKDVLFRAQKHFEWSPLIDNDPTHTYPTPAAAERMKPQKGRAPDGRANPRGIPFLYLSSNPQTAMSEVRPWIGSLITVAAMKLVRDVRIVDCCRFQGKGGSDAWPLLRIGWTELAKGKIKTPKPNEIEEIIWWDIDTAFSTPTEANDNTSTYVSTQILAELFRSKGFDGVRYKSRLRKDGYNFALFDLDIANPVDLRLYEVKTLNYSFEEMPP